MQDQVANPYAGVVPGSLGGATISRSQALKPYPYYTAVTARLPHLGSSIYHALLFTAERRLSNGVAVLASYTFGKLISDSAIVPSNFGAVEVGSDNGYQNGKYNRKAERSVDPTDVAQRLVLSGIVELALRQGQTLEFPQPARLTSHRRLAIEPDLHHPGRPSAGGARRQQQSGEPAEFHGSKCQVGQSHRGPLV